MTLEDQAMIKRAVTLGRLLHEGNHREEGLPYYTHPEGAALILGNFGYDVLTLSVELLHDVLEELHGPLSVDAIPYPLFF